MLHLLASGDPFVHTWDNWAIEAFGWHLDLRHVPGFEALGISKAVLMMLLAATLLLWIGIHAGRRSAAARAAGKTTRGVAGATEVMVEFVRNEMMRPNMPHHYKSVWFLSLFCTFFFFILFCNLIGLLPPPLGLTATGSPWVSGALGFGMTFVVMILAGMKEHGPFGYAAHLAPPSPWWIRWTLLIFIEIVGLVVKPFALMVRLAANMTAGHIILAVLMGFLTTVIHGGGLKVAVWLPSAIGFAAITLFEIVIAFIQAYIFTVLSCVFVGQSVSHEH